MKRKYQRDYFSKIDSIEKAYWLGFIAADGSISKTPHYSLSIGLKISDISHLESFAKNISYDGVIRKTCKAKACRIDLYSKQIVHDLIKHGITPNKTYSLKPWSGPKKFMQAYWRGFFDGDGGISSHIRKKKNNYKMWMLSLIGTETICDGFVKFIDIENKPNIQYRSDLKSVIWSSIRPCQKIVRKLYDGPGPCLLRKKLLADKILKQKVKENIIQVGTSKKMLLKMLKKHKSWESVAKHLGFSRNGLYKHIRKLDLPRRKWQKSQSAQNSRQ